MSDMSDKPVDAIEALKRIKVGDINARTIDKADRQPIVYYLRFVLGLQIQEIANTLKVTEKTIYRDSCELQATHSDHGRIIPLSPKQMANDLRSRASVQYAKAQRLGDPTGAFNIWCKLIDKLQSLGVMPKVAEKIQVTLSDEEAKEKYVERKQLIERMNKVVDADYIVVEKGGDNGTNGRALGPGA